jgi:hypothetical protein
VSLGPAFFYERTRFAESTGCVGLAKMAPWTIMVRSTNYERISSKCSRQARSEIYGSHGLRSLRLILRGTVQHGAAPFIESAPTRLSHCDSPASLRIGERMDKPSPIFD